MRANLLRSYPPALDHSQQLARQRHRCRRCGKYVWVLAPDGCCEQCSDYRPLGRWPDLQLDQLAREQAAAAAGLLPPPTNLTARRLLEAADAGIPALPPVLAAPRRWGR